MKPAKNLAGFIKICYYDTRWVQGGIDITPQQ